MSNDDICGYPTAADTPCQHPVTDEGDSNRCWVDGHNDDDLGNDPGGREFSIDEADHDDILKAAKLGMSKAGCARAAGVDKASLLRYLDEHEKFRTAFRRARAKGEQRLIERPLFDDPTAEREMDGQHARFLLSTSFEYSEKKELEHTGEGGGPIEITFQEEVVETDWEEPES